MSQLSVENQDLLPNENAENCSTLYPGDSTLTRRILKRCRDAGIEIWTETEAVRIGGGRWGSKTVAYHVPRRIYGEEKARRDEELLRKAAKEKEDRAEQQRRYRVEQVAKLTERFPHLPSSTIERLIDTERRVYSLDQLGYQHGIGTKSYWRQLGFDVVSEPTGVLVRGRRLYDTYTRNQLVPRSTRLTVARLKEKLLAKHRRDDLVLAHAIRIANRLQKVVRHPDLYSLKDQWIEANQDHLIEGRIARVETRTCWGCHGAGTVSDYWDDEEECGRCDGTGIYSSRTLYEHHFEIVGQRFVFHSYVEPKVVSEERGEDADRYGRPFTADELPCPPQSVLVSLIESMMTTTQPL
jgi:hypothetical protein